MLSLKQTLENDKKDFKTKKSESRMPKSKQRLCWNQGSATQIRQPGKYAFLKHPKIDSLNANNRT